MVRRRLSWDRLRSSRTISWQSAGHSRGVFRLVSWGTVDQRCSPVRPKLGLQPPPFPGTSRPRALRDVCCIRSSTPRPATLCDRATAGPPRGGGGLTPSMPHHPGSLRHEAMSESPWPPATTDIGAGVQDASPGGVQAAPLPTGAWPAGLWCPSSYSQMGLGVPSSTFAPQGP